MNYPVATQGERGSLTDTLSPHDRSMAHELRPENLTPSAVDTANYAVVDQFDFTPRSNRSTKTYFASTRTTTESSTKALTVRWQSISPQNRRDDCILYITMTINFPRTSDFPPSHRLRFCNIPWASEFDGCFCFRIFWDQALITYSFNNFPLDLENHELRSLSGDLILATWQRFDVLAFRKNCYQIARKTQHVVETSREHGIRGIFDHASTLE